MFMVVITQTFMLWKKLCHEKKEWKIELEHLHHKIESKKPTHIITIFLEKRKNGKAHLVDIPTHKMLQHKNNHKEKKTAK